MLKGSGTEHDLAGNGRASQARPRSLAEQIADDCGEMIVEGRFKGGERLTELQLAELFDVSRGPVREAIRLLEKRRLLEVLPRRGVYVRPITLTNIKDLFNVRIALAAMAARSTAEREADSYLETLSRRVEQMRACADSPDTDPLQFAYIMTRAVHTVVRASGNELADELWDDLNESSFWTTIWRAPLDARTPEVRWQRVREYETLVASLAAHDADAAERAMRVCLESTRDAALDFLRQTRPGNVALD